MVVRTGIKIYAPGPPVNVRIILVAFFVSPGVTRRESLATNVKNAGIAVDFPPAPARLHVSRLDVKPLAKIAR